MNLAFLFNSDHPDLGFSYGEPVMDLILSSGILQKEGRPMRVSVGDILTFGAVSQDYLEKLCHSVYAPISFDRLRKRELEETFTTATVYCWLFQNMTQEVGERLHLKLNSNDCYLGCMDVNFSLPLHLRFFRNSLIEKYRLTRIKCDIFYHMSLEEDRDIFEKNSFEKHGFQVNYEDRGARRTFFDNYDSIEHFKRVELFKSLCANLPELNDDDASALTHSLEELHPKLFDVFAAAAKALNSAETEEDYAQVAFSGRRLLENTANALFPPTNIKRNERNLGQAQYKNRLWAYVEDALSSNPSNDSTKRLDCLGKEVDRLVNLFNKGLHDNLTRMSLELAFRDLIIWLAAVININPSMARNPYQPYEKELESFLREILPDYKAT